MVSFQGAVPAAYRDGFNSSLRLFTDAAFESVSSSISKARCGVTDESENCRDDSAAFNLKLAAMAAILIAGVCGIAFPLVGRNCRILRTDGNLFFSAKAFAAGVILATGFVHMLPDATEALTNPCLPSYPWQKFPFSGFFAMMSALATLFVDFMATQYYERKQEQAQLSRVDSLESDSEAGIVEVKECNDEKVFGEEEGGGMHIVGMHAHAAHHRHSHPHGKEACDGNAFEPGGHGHSHSHLHGGADGAHDGVRHVVVSQILELGIVSHSVIIGLSLGVSNSPCTIRPLIAALSFHQFFEGFALGGCISQAQFKNFSATLMACFFTITTPAGIAIGIGVSSFYSSESARALVVEGILDSISAGILVYMALVDLIAADFLSKRMSCNPTVVVAYSQLRSRMEKTNGAPAGFEYSGEVAAILSELFSASDENGDAAKFNEEMVEKVMQEFLGEMKGLGSAEEVAGGRLESKGVAAATATDGGSDGDGEEAAQV